VKKCLPPRSAAADKCLAYHVAGLRNAHLPLLDEPFPATPSRRHHHFSRLPRRFGVRTAPFCDCRCSWLVCHTPLADDVVIICRAATRMSLRSSTSVLLSYASRLPSLVFSIHLLVQDFKMFGRTTLAWTAFALRASAARPKTQDGSQVIRDPLTYGPELELVHLYYDQFPTGIAVSSTGRLFSNYPGGLDANDTNNGQNGRYTIAELFEDNTERPYPSREINNPPGGAINYTTYPPSGANYQDYLIGSQSCVIDSLDRLWILDTGRVLTPNGTLVPASYGGPKLIGVNLSNDTIFKTIVFPTNVAYADSYLNDVRFDLRPSSAPGGQGIAYITDSSIEGRNGIVMADLGTGESWRHLDGNPTVHPARQFSAYLWGVPLYQNNPGKPFGYVSFGSDGIALSADGETLYWKAVANRQLYSIPTTRLRDTSPSSEFLAQGAINTLGETGVSDGLETDTNNFIYHGNMEQDAVSFFNPPNGTDTLFVRDPRLNWIDTFSTASDGYIYFTSNQLVYGSGQYPGTDRRQRPFALWRAKLPNNGTKTSLK